MKRNLLFILLFVSTMVSSSSFAQSKLIHYWHFNNANYNDTFPNIHPIPADYSLISTTTTRLIYQEIPGTSSNYATSYTVPLYMDTVTAIATDGDTLNARMGQPSGLDIRARNPSDSMEVLFYIPSTNYKNLEFKFATQASSRTHGQLMQMYQYSTDSGTTWRSSGLSMTADSAGYPSFILISLNFNGDTTVNNNSKLAFRITFSGNTTALSGNNRFDNVTLEGDSVTAPTNTHLSVANITANENEYTLYPNPVTSSLTISSDFAGTKSVMVQDVAGKTVFVGLASGTAFSLSVADLKSGVYFVTIRENNIGKSSNIKFIKQ